MNKRILVVALVLMLVLSMACAAPAMETKTKVAMPTETDATKTAETVPTAQTDAAQKPYRVAILLAGMISDAGWNASGYYGAKYLNENVENVEATYIENISVTNAEAAIRDYCEQGYNMVVGWSFDFGDYLMKVAPDYPEIAFVWSQGYMTTDNVCTVAAPLQETAYLCGVIAAKMSKSGVIGYIGGVDTMPMIAALEGYKAGARFVNPDIKVIHSFAGTWSDVELGKQTALAQFEQGVDVLMGRGDGIALGCMQACIEKGIYCFGDVDDQNSLAPQLILTSTSWDVGKNLEYVIKDVRAGTFEGKAYSLGLANGVTNITDFHGLVPDDIAKEVLAVRDQIASGDLVIEAKTEIGE
ncbi:MAG: BMP family protein [Clostridia bacterium]